MSIYLLVLLAVVSPVIEAQFPDGYVLKVTPVCGDGLNDDPNITITTDLKISARAECLNGVYPFINTNNDNVNFKLAVAFPGRDTNKCEFIKRAGAHVYVVKVIISYGEAGQMVSQDDAEVTVTCTYDAKTSEETNSQHLAVPLIAAKELLYNTGRLAANSTVTMELTNVIGNDITGQNLDLGRKVQLKAESDGGSGELGLRPISCNAIGENTGKKYAILRAGCGDGIIFAKDEGFQVSGLVARSPYFPTFHLENDNDFSFQCNFTICETNCDGNSCALQRRLRRDTSGVDGHGGESHQTAHLDLVTKTIHIVKRTQSHDQDRGTIPLLHILKRH